MSQENVEMVKVIHDGWSRGDFAVGAELLTADFRWQQHAEAVEPGSRSGAAIGDTFRNIFAIYDDYRIEPDEFIDAGDKVVVAVRVRATAKVSRIPVDQRFNLVWSVEEGRLAGIEVFTQRTEALEAAGLSE
jgi:ketosteroid isomerase-like protein